MASHAPNHSIKKKLRLCLDPRDLNKALEREPYYCRSIDELIAKFSEAEFFSIVDMDKGYWQVLLDSSSRKYTCMAPGHRKIPMEEVTNGYHCGK